MNIKRYNEIKKESVKVDNVVPKSTIVSPTEGDYSAGYVIRYFLQMRDTKGSPIFEVDNLQFSIFSNKPYYIGVSVKWRITGNLDEKTYSMEDGSLIKQPSVVNSNRIVVETAAKTMPDIKLYLVNLKQFWKNL
jgi:hypothetical protein